MSASAVAIGLVQPLRQERALVWCVLASIALHALVFLGLSSRDAQAPPEKALLVLSARLAPVAVTPPEPAPQAQPMPVPPALVAQPPKPAARLAPNNAAPRPVPDPRKTPPPAAVKTAPPEAAAPATAVSSAQPAAPSPAGSAAQAAAAIPKAVSVKSGSEADKGTLERYRLALISATKRYKRYPAIAMEKGWQGRVVVHMAIGADGMLAEASIKTSSGHPVLDKQAVNMLKKGKTTVQIPASLRGREFGVDVPVIFNLDDPRS